MKDKFWAKREHAKKTGCRVSAKLNAIGRMVDQLLRPGTES
ncbi:MAG TPA: hypothetical protein VN381_16265 [Anaerovoracaceae bacterium]|nr:hypothetical protein [Anaerovoracaceae bacterium]